MHNSHTNDATHIYWQRFSHNPNNDRNTKGGRGSRQATRDGKRAYDRRSGTGRGKETKKGGGGARNWGSDKNDAKRAEGAVVEGQEAANTPEGEEVEDKRAEEAEEVEEEEPDNTMTFEEYLASKAKPESDNFKSIKVREVDDEFAGKMAKVAVEEDFLVMGGGKNLRKKGGKAGKEKQSIDVGFRVAKPSSGGGDRDRRERGRREGGRSGGNDRRGRDGRSGGRGGGDRKGGRSAKINTTDTNAFPSL